MLFSHLCELQICLHVVFLFCEQRSDQPCGQLEYFSLLCSACQYVDGYHHHEDVLQAGEKGRESRTIVTHLQKRLTFIATPLTRGQLFLLTLNLWYARPAFNKGLSILPPPDTTPTNALQLLDTVWKIGNN